MFGTMNIIDEGLLNEIRKAEREMDRLRSTGAQPHGIRDAARGSYPPINIGATAEQVDVYLFAAGLIPEEIEITIHEQLLTIAGERRLISEAGADYYRRERYNGEFRRAVTLPADVDPEKVEAVYNNGVLHITVIRREVSKPKQVKIS